MLENLLLHKIFHLFTKMKYRNCQNTYINSISEFVKILIQLQNIPTIYLFSIEYLLTKIPLLCKISPTLQNQSGNVALLSAYKPYIRTSVTLWYISSIFVFQHSSSIWFQCSKAQQSLQTEEATRVLLYLQAAHGLFLNSRCFSCPATKSNLLRNHSSEAFLHQYSFYHTVLENNWTC